LPQRNVRSMLGLMKMHVVQVWAHEDTDAYVKSEEEGKTSDKRASKRSKKG
jgi:hypothetical protein